MSTAAPAAPRESTKPALEPPRVPTWFIAFCAVVSVVSVSVMIAGAWQTGSPWDEADHVEFLTSYFATGYNTYEGTVVNGQAMTFSPWVAGPAYELLLHRVTSILGLEQWGQPVLNADIAAVRHVVIALTTVLATAVTAVIAGVLTRSYRWGIVGFTVLISIPMWLGHGMFNNKDIPVALAYTAVTLALILLLRGGPSLRLWPTLAAGAILIAGITLAVGTRLGIWAPLAISFAAASLWLAYTAIRVRRAGTSSGSAYLARILAIVVSSVLSYLILVAMYPKIMGQFGVVFRKSLGESSNFGQSGASKSWRWIPELSTYVPKWLFLQLPLLQLALFALVIVLGVLSVRALFTIRRWDSWRTPALVLICLQLAVAPIASALLRSNVYDGIRHFLFILPSIAVLATLALRRIIAWTAAREHGRVLTRVAWAVTAFLLVLPLVDQIRLFPYGYAYVNEITTLRPVKGNVSTDYWRLSFRELMPSVPAAEYTSCEFRYTSADQPPGTEYPCNEQGAFTTYSDLRTEPLADLGPDEIVFLEANRGLDYPPSNCEILDEVTRTLHGQELVMSYVARCEKPS